MKWSDIHAIAEALFDAHPDIDPLTVRFTDLHNWVVELDGFDDDHTRGGEKVLEAIQMAWIDEARAKGAAAAATAVAAPKDVITAASNMPEIKDGQSVALLQELHILTRDGKMNQDSRRKLKQVYHLTQFIEPLLREVQLDHPGVSLVDHGAGKSYLGFILYDLFFKNGNDGSHIYGIETREELVQRSQELAKKFKFPGMSFLPLSVAESTESTLLPQQIDIVTALHACNTATDDAIHFALKKKAKFMVLVPCCQAEVASVLKKNKGKSLGKSVLTELWRHPLHTREFGSQITNVLRCLQLEAHGYQVSVTELVGWEHSMKNELIIASYKNLPRQRPTERLQEVLQTLGLEEMGHRFFAEELAKAGA